MHIHFINSHLPHQSARCISCTHNPSIHTLPLMQPPDLMSHEMVAKGYIRSMQGWSSLTLSSLYAITPSTHTKSLR
eukprot:c8974_g1_i1 orf=3-227(-)